MFGTLRFDLEHLLDRKSSELDHVITKMRKVESEYYSLRAEFKSLSEYTVEIEKVLERLKSTNYRA